METAKYVTFEGPDGSGKTTQIRLVKEYLNGFSLPLALVREPGGTPLAENLRNLLLSPEQALINGQPETLTGVSELFIFLSARAQLFEYVVLTQLASGINILGDRGRDSTRAYQGAGRFKDDPCMLERIDDLNDVATQNRRPDLTIVFDLPVEIIFERIHARDEKELASFEKTCQADFYQRVREQFLAIAQREPNRVVVINGSQPVDQVFEQIRPHIDKLFGLNQTN